MNDELAESIREYLKARSEQVATIEKFWKSNQLNILVHPLRMTVHTSTLELTGRKRELLATVVLTVDESIEDLTRLKVELSDELWDAIQDFDLDPIKDEETVFEVFGKNDRLVLTVIPSFVGRKLKRDHCKVQLADWILQGFVKAGYQIAD